MLSILIPYSLYLAYIPLENKLSNIIRTILYCFYVIIQILSICIFPILIEYEVAGEFTFKERLIASFKKNIIFYSICLMLGVLVFTYLLIKQQISLNSLIENIIALLNAWGLLIIIFLNGFGLVSIPKNLLKSVDYKSKIKFIEYQASKLSDEIDDFSNSIMSISKKVKASINYLNDNNITDCTNINNKEYSLSKKLDIMWNLLSKFNNNFISVNITEEDINFAKNIKGEKLNSLNYKLKKLCNEHNRANNKLNELYEEWENLKVIIKSKFNNSNNDSLDNSVFSSFDKSNKNLTNQSVDENIKDNIHNNNYSNTTNIISDRTIKLNNTPIFKFYKTSAFPVLITGLGILCSLLSIMLLISEMTMFAEGINLSIFGYIIENITDNNNKSGEYGYLVLIITIIPFIYLLNTTMYSLFHLKLSGIYGIYKNKHTDAESLLLLSSIMCRIAFPLGLNFIQLLKLSKKTVFEEIMITRPNASLNSVTKKSSHVLPLIGYKFSVIFPALLGILCLFNYFNIFGKLLNCVGLSSFGFENSATTNQINEGNIILSKMSLKFKKLKNEINEIGTCNNDNNINYNKV